MWIYMSKILESQVIDVALLVLGVFYRQRIDFGLELPQV